MTSDVTSYCPTERSHKQVKKGNDHGLAAKDEVKIAPTRADTKKTKDEVGMMTSQL